MSLVQITMQREAAHDTIAAFGELGLVEFKDLSSELNAYQRQYANEVKRCEELERVLRYFEKQLNESEINRVALSSVEAGEPEKFHGDMFALETTFLEKEQELLQLQSSLEQMLSEKNKSEELVYVIKHGENLLRVDDDQSIGEHSGDEDSHSPLVNDPSVVTVGTGTLDHLTGVIARNKISTFITLCGRITRGNMIPKFSEIPEKLYDEKTNQYIDKSVFTLFVPQRSKLMITKICDMIGANLHVYPSHDILQAQRRLHLQISQLEQTIDSTKMRRDDILSDVHSNLESYKYRVASEKSIFHTMNMMDYNIAGSVIAEGWVPTKHLDLVRTKLDQARITSGAQIESYMESIKTSQTPPTYFETNVFTQCFQDIVSAYGIPRYKEINPAVFTIISFPFLFAVMFGDWGHGLIMCIFAASLIAYQKRLTSLAESSEMFGMIFHGRFVLLLMGLFSVYTGMIYNDVFGLSLDLFGTGYPEFLPNVRNNLEGTFNNQTYVFGVDPAWYGTSNKLLFYNSLKMKMSVILGICQMSVGILLAGVNMVQFGHYFDLFVEFIPELLMLLCTFGYMSVLIIIKWCTRWEFAKGPSILPTMTDFFLHFWEIQQKVVFGTKEGRQQQIIQQICLFFFVISIPTLLLGKPLYILFKRSKRSSNTDQHVLHHDEDEHSDNDHHNIMLQQAPTGEHGEHDEGEEPFGEIMIKQLIHTIEFTLNVVSNTASYLRLWALSLAHAQLSEVFWDMTMKLLLTVEKPWLNTLLVESGLGVAVMWLVWFSLTIGVLLLMESLSAFLHALRLHWVEFQSKFFAGDGHAFRPYHIDSIIKEAEMEATRE